ncbi:MAG: glycosyltransferase, partial [Ignavibacteria bacterium]|nr:glycosyltransferase [Ignavibacteria bacterium]
MKFYCSYFDRNYLVKALALIDSLIRYEEQDFKFYAVCLDEYTRLILDNLKIENVIAIPVHEIEWNDAGLIEAKKNRSLVEYYWTLTPTIIQRILQNNPGIDVLTYLDADLFFYSDPQVIMNELGDASVLIHSHRFPPRLKHLEIYGKYNVGLLVFRNNEDGVRILNWWRGKCNEWCYNKLEGERFADQKYLDEWGKTFRGVAETENIGVGLGPWNHEQYKFSIDQNKNIMVNDSKVVVYHFHSFVIVNEDLFIPSKITDYLIAEDVQRFIYLPYISEILKNISKIKNVDKEFNFGINDSNVLGPDHTFIAGKSLRNVFSASRIPQVCIGMDSVWDCYRSNKQFQEKESQFVTLPENAAGSKSKDESLSDSALTLDQSSENLLCVSSIVSVYNSEKFIRGCLENLVGQTLYKKGQLEIVVVNTGSQQNEEVVVKQFQEKYLN